MLLTMASANDETAERFTSYAKSVGMHCAITGAWSDLDISLIASRDGRSQVELCFGPDRIPIDAVMNRGIPVLAKSLPEEQFPAAEWLASWWSTLACFPGPVLNRPTRFGFIPNLENLSLRNSVPNVHLPPGFIGTKIRVSSSHLVSNVHRLRDGQYLGRFVEKAPLDEAEVFIVTPFDPDKTVHILIAGNYVFDLSNPSGRLAPQLAEVLSPLLCELRRRHATFSLLVVQQDHKELILLHASALPYVHQYRHIEAEVHHALLEYLTP